MESNPRLRRTGARLHRFAEGVVAALLGVMFVAFIVQIAFRYVFNFPVGWAAEVSVIAWLWLVLWGSAFVLEEREEIRFDLVSSAVSRRTRIAMGIVIGIAIVVLYAMSLPATIDYVTFMKVERTAYLGIRFDWLFSIYVIFAVAVIVRYLWILSRLLRGKDLDAVDVSKMGSGL